AVSHSAVSSESAAVDSRKTEPGRQRVELGIDRLGDGAREANILVDRMHLQHRRLAVGERIDLPDQLIVVQDRKREIAPPPLTLRLVHLQLVVEVKQLLGADAIVDEPVEGREQRSAPLERLL